MITLIGFDLDDTLWHLKPVLIRAEAVLAGWLEANIPGYLHDPRTLQLLRQEIVQKQPRLLGKLTQLRHRLIQQALILHGLSDTESETLASGAMVVFLQARNQVDLFDNATTILEKLAKQFRLCALSNGNADIHQVGLQGIFEFAYSAEDKDIGAPKPAADMFQAALKRCAIPPEQMIYVGDDPDVDIDAAAQLGIYTIWMDHGRKPQGQHPPSARITDINMLPAAIQAIAIHSVQ